MTKRFPTAADAEHSYDSISQRNRKRHLRTGLVNTEIVEEITMRSLYEELGGTYTLGSDGMLYPDLTVEETGHCSIGKWGRMHKAWLEATYPGLCERLILKGTLYKHLADTNERAVRMLEPLTKQMTDQEGITEHLKKEHSMDWIGRMNCTHGRAEEIIKVEVIQTL